MKFDAKVKGGLAWAGLFVVLAVPSADILFGDKDASAPASVESARVASVTDTVEPSAAPALKVPSVKKPVADPAAVASSDPVDTYLSTGKKLPDYISDGASPAPVAVTVPKATGTASDTTEVASLPEVAPIPLPRTARPVATVAAAPAEAPVVIVDTPQVANVRPPAVPPAPVISGDQLEEWDSGSLADYLERKGLLSGEPVPQEASDSYDPDGFYLDEGPNNSRGRRPRNDDFFFF